MRCKNDSDAALMLSDAEKAIRRASYEWLHNGHDFDKTAKKLTEATGLLDALVLGATLAIWSEHSADGTGTQPFDVEDALRSALKEI